MQHEKTMIHVLLSFSSHGYEFIVKDRRVLNSQAGSKTLDALNIGSDCSLANRLSMG